ncbi:MULTISPECIES: thiamine diphosphokinase [Brucella]|jgi:thiamine pyrophosphokinase|uniref:Thiamine diphosphokinase n=1 Tax=Brucella pseudogrignonensis TaxID=419475 RepID=A0A256GPA9_9HYPH|nr:MULTISPECIES: thiamine diphosphokinase [Brucella]EMG53696.1 thiamine pyrophosphokinase [Ochrobactrum sp. CDB2]MBK0023412.1 thiamine diphosphokinase [Ochrobactrum sp. S45]MBK0045218.1 thiamine diphosphokinase [Ochrobactrum sp. S46]MBO1026220.1 thiamine diphosphokinase [Ochrobactrum sp. SD129]MQP42283.1 thiamine diphosphokinase [Ochrobactrum sp. MYb237]
MSTFVILLGGDLVVTDRLKSQIAGARVLAADSGIRHAAALDVEPELWLGDFDSASDALQKQYAHVPQKSFPRAKDMTDGELALSEAYERGAEKVILCGAFGGARTDHTLLHLTMATAQAADGRNILLSSGEEEAWPLVPGDYLYDFADGTSFSVINFCTVEGLSIKNAEWPLDNVTLPFGSSWTVSNIVRGTLCVSVRSGLAILVANFGEETPL